MVPRNEKIVFTVCFLLSSFVAWNLWFGAPQFAQIASEWALDVPAYIDPVFRYHKVFILLPVLVVISWLLPQVRKHRGWICVGLGLLSILVQAGLWVPIFTARAVTG